MSLTYGVVSELAFSSVLVQFLRWAVRSLCCLGVSVLGQPSPRCLLVADHAFLIDLCMMALVWNIMNNLGEIAVYLPLKGATIPYFVERFVEPSLAFAAGWNYWYAYAILVAGMSLSLSSNHLSGLLCVVSSVLLQHPTRSFQDAILDCSFGYSPWAHNLPLAFPHNPLLLPDG